tara:strand:- start:267 stop:1082 length:816 start_codon:yes stop_codon:yes gene_type:complete
MILQKHHIIDLYCLVDDLLLNSKSSKTGRPTILNSSELITVLIWNTLVVKQKTLKDIHRWMILYHQKDFPKIPSYPAFVVHCHRVAPYMHLVLQQLLATDTETRFMDSTMIPVCKLARASNHKVAKNIAKFGKNHQGWHYGFKFHASIDYKGRFCGLALTSANVHDIHAMPKILNEHAKIAVGDGGYTARVMRDIIWKNYGTIIISPPHPKQNKKLMTSWQYLLLAMRPKIEAVFDYLKEHLHLVSSFPRSVKGYLLHYLRILLGYQFMML